MKKVKTFVVSVFHRQNLNNCVKLIKPLVCAKLKEKNAEVKIDDIEPM